MISIPIHKIIMAHPQGVTRFLGRQTPRSLTTGHLCEGEITRKEIAPEDDASIFQRPLPIQVRLAHAAQLRRLENLIGNLIHKLVTLISGERLSATLSVQLDLVVESRTGAVVTLRSSVSSPCSSNRTCTFRASGFRFDNHVFAHGKFRVCLVRYTTPAS